MSCSLLEAAASAASLSSKQEFHSRARHQSPLCGVAAGGLCISALALLRKSLLCGKKSAAFRLHKWIRFSSNCNRHRFMVQDYNALSDKDVSFLKKWQLFIGTTSS